MAGENIRKSITTLDPPYILALKIQGFSYGDVFLGYMWVLKTAVVSLCIFVKKNTTNRST